MQIGGDDLEKIRSIIFKKGQTPKVSILEKDYVMLEEIVGGYLEFSKIFGGVCIIHNENNHYSDVLGNNFIVTGVTDDDEICSLTESQMQYVLTSFSNPKQQSLNSNN